MKTFKLSNLLEKYKLKDYKFILLISVLSLAFIGVMVIGSARESLQSRQIFGMIVGAICMIVISLINYTWISKFYWLIYGLNIVLLLAVRLFGHHSGGATRWLDFGFITFQPSELSKFLLIVFFAKFILNHEDMLHSPKVILKAIGLLLPPITLIYLQPDGSTTFSIVAVFCILLYVGGLSYKIIGTVLLVLIPVSLIFLSIAVRPDQPFLKGYQQQRILAWLQPEKYKDTALQQTNSIIAIGSGQLSGKGLNNNTTTSLKNGNYLLEPETDFIFTIVGEELGFIGACTIIGLQLLIVVQCILVGWKASDILGQIICTGVAAQIGIQSFINISVTTGILPTTGIPLPFVSYGLTSLVSFMIGIGLVLNVGLQPKKHQ